MNVFLYSCTEARARTHAQKDRKAEVLFTNLSERANLQEKGPLLKAPKSYYESLNISLFIVIITY